MNIKQFLNKNKKCLKCNNDLCIEIVSHNQPDEKYTYEIKNDRFTINLFTHYFVEPHQGPFKLSLLFKNNNIIKTKSMEEYISLYGINVKIFKKCDNCKTHIDYIYPFFYSVSFVCSDNKSYELDLNNEGFTFEDDKSIYYFSNSFFLNRASLVRKDKITNNTVFSKKLSHIPLYKFDFNNPEKVLNKFNTIMLLV